MGIHRHVEHWHARFPATAVAVQAIRGEMEAAARRCGLADERVHDVRLAVSEAATNVVLHAYRDEPPGSVAVTASAEGGRLRIVISDEGVGMVPRLDSPGFGMGLPLIARLADEVEIVSREEGGTDVRIIFPCPASA